MAENSKIEWTHHTFNPWRGCSKVSPGCTHCYAERMAKRRPDVLGIWGDNGIRIIAKDSYWQLPHKWNKAAQQAGERHRVFCGSMMDVFEGPESMPFESWQGIQEARIRLWQTIIDTPHLDWLLLTKRPEHAASLLPEGGWYEGLPDNVWIGTSAENQATADERINKLLNINARVRFLSCEPLLGPVNLTHWLQSLDWIICGGESGPQARPMHPQWARALRDQCQETGIAFFFKQWGEWMSLTQISTFERNEFDIPDRTIREPYRETYYKAMERHQWGAFTAGGEYYPVTTTWNGRQGNPDDNYEVTMVRLGKKAAGRLLDGREWNEVYCG